MRRLGTREKVGEVKMTLAGKAACPPHGEGRRPELSNVRRDTDFTDAACAVTRPTPRAGLPKIAFLRWLASHPGRKPSDFQPLIKEAEFAWRCRSTFSAACEDVGGARAVERHLRNLELGLCCGWRVLDLAEARSLFAWLDAVLPHHPWGAALDWRDSGAREELALYCEEEWEAAPEAEDTGRMIAAAGLADTLEQAWTFASWRDVQGVVLSAWLGGTLLVDDNGHLVAGWKRAFAGTLASRINSLH
jgi:hypothetical protein